MQKTEKYKLNLIEKADTFSPDPLNENMEKVEKALSGGLEAEAAARQIADAAEAQARAEADAAEAQTRAAADAAEAQTRAAADTAEAQARAAADTAEAQARTKADAALGQRVTALEARRVVFGCYAPGSQQIDINLGFRPNAVLAISRIGVGGLAVPQNENSYELKITDNGFSVGPCAENTVFCRPYQYSYIAFL